MRRAVGRRQRFPASRGGVRLSGGRLYVTDRATTNGTFVLDGDAWRRIRQAFLKPGGRVRFGDVEMSAGRAG